MTEQVEKPVEEKAKVIDFKEGKLLIEKSFELDPNKDGEAVAGVAVKVWLDISEIPDEVVALLTKKDK